MWPRLSKMYAIEMWVPLSVSGTHMYDSVPCFPPHIVTHPSVLSARASVSHSVSLSHLRPGYQVLYPIGAL